MADGKRLASEPAPAATYYENIRARKIQRAALEGPTLAGYRCVCLGVGVAQAGLLVGVWHRCWGMPAAVHPAADLLLHQLPASLCAC